MSEKAPTAVKNLVALVIGCSVGRLSRCPPAVSMGNTTLKGREKRWGDTCLIRKPRERTLASIG